MLSTITVEAMDAACYYSHTGNEISYAYYRSRACILTNIDTINWYQQQRIKENGQRKNITRR